jgi:hypothetical protein
LIVDEYLQMNHEEFGKENNTNDLCQPEAGQDIHNVGIKYCHMGIKIYWYKNMNATLNISSLD